MALTRNIAYFLVLYLLLSPIETMPLDPVTDSSVGVTGDVHSRVKRAIIGTYGTNGCGKGQLRLLTRKGPCVSCEVYMEQMDTDECPI